MSCKRNEFLDISDEEEELVHNSDIEQDSRLAHLSTPSSKRRKLNHGTEEDLEDASQDEDDDISDDVEHTALSQTALNLREETGDGSTPASHNKSLTSTVKPLTPAQLATSQRKARKTGVIYLSRIPPFMKPSTLRRLLSPYGELLRIFLTPEPPPAHAARVRAGGNKKRSFVDGWVEFASKRKARACAELLNANTVGGRKGGWYHDDLWNVKYLRGFKWADLMEQVQGEEREREGRLRAEIGREERERRAFLGNVERSKRERGMEGKRRRKMERSGEGVELEGEDKEQIGDVGMGRKELKRSFRQNEVRVKGDELAAGHPEHVRSILGKIF